MKLNIRQISAFILILAVICLILECVLCYWVGYFEKSYIPITIWRILRMIGFSLVFIQLFVWISSLIRRINRLWTTIILIFLLAFKWFEAELPSASNLIVYGMRDRIRRDYSLDILRHFALDFDRLPKLQKQDVKYGATESFKEYLNGDLANTGLKDKYPFIAWIKNNGRSGPEIITEEDGVVSVGWGGRPEWGFCVGVNGVKTLSTDSNVKSLRVSDDIYYFINEGD